jgi:hypothetical protein
VCTNTRTSYYNTYLILYFEVELCTLYSQLPQSTINNTVSSPTEYLNTKRWGSFSPGTGVKPRLRLMVNSTFPPSAKCELLFRRRYHKLHGPRPRRQQGSADLYPVFCHCSGSSHTRGQRLPSGSLVKVQAYSSIQLSSSTR